MGAYVAGVVSTSGPNAAAAEPLLEELLCQGLTHSEAMLLDFTVDFLFEEVRWKPAPGDGPDQDFPVRTVASGAFVASGQRFRIDVHTTEEKTGRVGYSIWLNNGEVLTWMTFAVGSDAASEPDMKTARLYHWPTDHQFPEAILFDPRKWVSFELRPLSSLLSLHSDATHLYVEPVDVHGGRCFRLTVPPGLPGGSDAVLLVNAVRGYLLQQRRIDLGNGVRSVVDIEADTQDGVVWYPKTVWERVYMPVDAAGEKPLSVERRVEFSDWVFRPDLPSAAFELALEVLGQVSPNRVRDHR